MRGPGTYQTALTEARLGIVDPADNYTATFSGLPLQQNFWYQFDVVQRPGYLLPNEAFVALPTVRHGAEAPVTLVKDDKGNWKPDGATFPLDKPTVARLVAAAAAPPVVRLADYGPAVKWALIGASDIAATRVLPALPSSLPVTAAGRGRPRKAMVSGSPSNFWNRPFATPSPDAPANHLDTAAVVL